MTASTNSPAGATVAGLTVPNDLSSLDSHSLPWMPADYAGIASGATAEKLFSSAIAPVVAAARGYKQISDGGRSAAKKRFQLPDWNTKQGRRLAGSLKGGDVLVMPWYTPEAVVQGQTAHRDAEFSTIQYRPEKAGVHDNGREAKYEFVVGSASIIGLHPSTPKEWLTESVTVSIAEGLLKADAMISAMLIASARITNEELLLNADPDFNHQAHLTTLMMKLEREFRIPVHCIGGVYNWKNNPEWNSIDLKNKEVWSAIDGDVATNINVHRATSQLWEFLKTKKKATLRLLSPEIVTGDGGETIKMGVDDFLFSVGNWDSLLKQLADTLPPKPAGESKLNPGQEMRVSVETGQVLGKPKPLKDANGMVLDWEDGDPVTDFAPVIKATRFIKDDLKNEPAAVDHDIEVTMAATLKTWLVTSVKDEDLGNPRKWLVQVDGGKGTSLTVPTTPTGRAEFENAMRSHGADEREYVTILRRTGWVELSSGEWGYVTPRGTLTRHGIDESVRSKLAIANYQENFYLPDPSGYTQEERFEALEAVVGMPHLFVDSLAYHAAWGQAIAAVTGKRPEGTIGIVGLKGSGKTFTVEECVTTAFGRGFGFKRKVLGASLRAGTKGVKLNLGSGLHHSPGLLEDVRDIKVPKERDVQTEVVDTWIGRGYEGSNNTRGRLASDNAGGYDELQGDQAEPLTMVTVEKVEYMDLLPSSLQRMLVVNMTKESSMKKGSAATITKMADDGHVNLSMAIIIQTIAEVIMTEHDGDWASYEKGFVQENFDFVRANFDERLPLVPERQLDVASSPTYGFMVFRLLLDRVEGFSAFIGGEEGFGEFDGGCGGPVFDKFVKATADHDATIPGEEETHDNPAERLLSLITSACSRGDMLLKMATDKATPEEDRGRMVGIFDAEVADPDNDGEMTPVVYLDIHSVAKILGGGWDGSAVRSTLKPLCVRNANKNGHRPYLDNNNDRPGNRLTAVAVRRDIFQPEDSEA